MAINLVVPPIFIDLRFIYLANIFILLPIGLLSTIAPLTAKSPADPIKTAVCTAFSDKFNIMSIVGFTHLISALIFLVYFFLLDKFTSDWMSDKQWREDRNKTTAIVCWPLILHSILSLVFCGLSLHYIFDIIPHLCWNNSSTRIALIVFYILFSISGGCILTQVFWLWRWKNDGTEEASLMAMWTMIFPLNWLLSPIILLCFIFLLVDCCMSKNQEGGFSRLDR
jgi:uncharacterized membrane protein